MSNPFHSIPWLNDIGVRGWGAVNPYDPPSVCYAKLWRNIVCQIVVALPALHEVASLAPLGSQGEYLTDHVEYVEYYRLETGEAKQPVGRKPKKWRRNQPPYPDVEIFTGTNMW
jgi:hypothetical protein